MQVPFVDLKMQYQNLKSELQPVIEDVCAGARFIMGPELSDFEGKFAKFVGARHVVGVSTGTDALMMALRAAGVGAGDEVITAANTFIATVLGISAAGASPVLVDCDEDYYTVDPVKIESAVTNRTRAIIPVHLYGQPADMKPILEIAKKHGLLIIEDACQSHGSEYHGKVTGTFGIAGCFSFFPGKNLGAYGDGGGVATDDPAIDDRLRMLRNYGQRKKYHHEVKGWNYRLDNLQAGILNVKLKHLADWNRARAAAAREYTKLLSKLRDFIVTPQERPDCTHVYHLYIVRAKKRDNLQDFLQEKGVSTGIHYPIPIHLLPAYKELGGKKGDFPLTERFADEILSLPMFPEITKEQIAYTVRCIEEFYS